MVFNNYIIILSLSYNFLDKYTIITYTLGMKETLYQYNPWWEEPISLEAIKDRPRILSSMENLLNTKSIVILTGLRRVGKTTLLKLFIQRLIHKGANPKHIFYVSLDDYTLINKSILDIISEYRKIFKLPLNKKIYLFLDEITYKKNPHLQLKNLYDNQNVKIYTSSSSTSLLKDKKALLTGRERILEIAPLDFEEFCQFRNITIKQKENYLKEPYFEDYMKTGGIPEYVLHPDREYLKTLVDDIIYKDIIAYHNIKNPQMIKDYFMLLMERAGKQISINKMAKILSIAPDTAKRYLSMFAETYLIYLIPRHGKTNETLLSPKKGYAPDLGIRTLFTGFRDKGSLFENYIFLKIRQASPSYIYEDGIEIDFYTQNKTLIESKYYRELTKKQLNLFNRIKATKKLIIKDPSDIHLLNDL